MTESSKTKKAIIVVVNSRYVRKGEEDEVFKDTSEVVAVHEFTTRPAVIKRNYGMTVSLGNYESARFDVGIEVPCYLEDVEKADQFAADFCEKRMKEEYNTVRSGSGKKSAY